MSDFLTKIENNMFRIKALWVVVAILLTGHVGAQPKSDLTKIKVSDLAQEHAIVNIWPQIPFVRGKDLCQYHDAYGRTKREQMAELTQTVRGLPREGVDSRNMVALLNAMDDQLNQQKSVAGSSPGMDIFLAGTLKASLDKVYRERNPQTRRFAFFNPSPLNELMRQKRSPLSPSEWDPFLIRGLSGVAYGTYSYAPSCKGDLLVTVHIDLACGHTYHFQAQGLPEHVMQNIGLDIFETFQRTQFPSKLKIGNQQLELVGAPGTGVGSAPSPKSAEMACKAMKARLPTEDEYEYLSNVGDWNGGVTCARGKLWAMANNMVMAPDLRNPSPVRSVAEFPGKEFSYYCVR